MDGALLPGGGKRRRHRAHGGYGAAPGPYGRSGRLEASTSGRSLTRHYAPGSDLRAEAVAEPAFAGDEATPTVFTDAGRLLGEGITHAAGSASRPPWSAAP